jgi:hypothetical protein
MAQANSGQALNGNAASAYGGGGGGGNIFAVATSVSGGAGSAGVVIVTEYIGAATVAPTPASGSRVLLSSQVITVAQNSVVFTGIDATYDEYVVEVLAYATSVTNSIGIQVSQNGGSTWLTTGYTVNFLAASSANPTTPMGGSQAATYWWTTQWNNTSNSPMYGTFRLFQPANASFAIKHMLGIGTNSNTSGSTLTQASGSIVLGSPFTYNAIKLISYNQTNSFTGVFKLYGIVK